MATTATRNKKTGKVEVDNDGASASATEVAKKPRAPRVTHELPSIGESVRLNELEFRTSTKSSKYAEIVAAIQKLKLKQGIKFHPNGDETVESLKSRIQALVSRSCAKSAPEGSKYRTRITAEDDVVVYLDVKKANETDEE